MDSGELREVNIGQQEITTKVGKEMFKIIVDSI